MSTKRTRSYDKEFKLNAVKLYLAQDRSYKQPGQELGVPEATLAGWVKNYQHDGTEAFPGKGYQKESDSEVTALRRELAITREERDILKKALGIFSSPRK